MKPTSSSGNSKSMLLFWEISYKSYSASKSSENDLSVDSLIEDESSFDISAISSIFSKKNLQIIVSLILTMSFLNIFILWFEILYNSIICFLFSFRYALSNEWFSMLNLFFNDSKAVAYVSFKASIDLIVWDSIFFSSLL